MLFDTLEIPESLLVAQDEGKLVVFAGAGVSIGPPSGLPSFEKLAEMIAQRPLRRSEKLRLDHFLGELKTEGRDVHALAAQALDQPASRPTPLHEQLVRLFASPEQVRIVTTNFDPHFRSVALRAHPNLPVYAAPALPRGGDFHGLVHLHGALGGQPRDLVLTDEDFGRSYLTEGWARVFLEQLFARYFVLFVGYSHTDPPVHYIARGLPSEPQPRRFVITTEEPSRWKRLGIGVISFSLGRGPRRYAALAQGVTRWADVTRGSSFWLEDQIIQILARPDPSALSAEEANLLEWSLAQDRTVPFFVRNARGLIWVDWLGSRRLLAPFFDPRADLKDWHQRQVAVWLADQLLTGPHERSLEIIRSHGGHFSRELYRWLLNQVGDTNLPVAWTFLLAQEMDLADQDAHYVFGTRLRAFAIDNLPAFWALLRACTDPRVGLDAQGFGGAGQPAYSRVGITGDAGVIWSVWREAIFPRIEEFARPLLLLLLAQLERAAQLARAIGEEDAFVRDSTRGRTRLSVIDDTLYRESRPNVLVDMLAQVIIHLAQRRDGLADAEIRTWLDSTDSVVRRLGLHAVEESVDLADTTKERWARACATDYPANSPEQRAAAALLGRLSTPAPRAHATAEPASPPTPDTLPPLDELLAMRSQQLALAVMRPRLAPTAVLVTLRQLAAANLRDHALASHPLWDLLLGRLSWRQLPPDERDELLALLHPPFSMASHARAVLRSVFDQDPLEKDSSETHSPVTPAQVARLFSVSQALWELLRDEAVAAPDDYAGTDWVSLSLNDGIGTYHLVRFWMQYVSVQPHDAASPALPVDVAAIFEDICERATEVARHARAVLIQDMRFVMVRDPAWTTTHMVPLFDFATGGDQAWVAWRAFLDHGRFSRPLALALLPHYLTAQDRMLAAGDKVVGEYLQDVASIVVHVRPPTTGEWLRSLLPALPPDERLRWARLVGRETEGLPDDGQRDLWETWLGEYWRDRRTGRLGATTMPLVGREAAIMVSWLPNLPVMFAVALDLVRQSPAPDFAEEPFVWRELRSSSLPSSHPVEFLGLVEFLLAHMDSSRVHHESITEAAGRLPRLAVLRAPLLRIAEAFQQHSWMPARDFLAWVTREFPEPEAAT